MTTIRLKRDPRSGAYVSLTPPCRGCRGCAPKISTLALDSNAEILELKLSASAQARVLWNSFGKPVAYTLLFVATSELAGWADGPGIGMAILGFAVGYWHCRVVPETELEKTGVA